MHFRFIKIVVLLALLAGAFAGVARALDFDDDDPEPIAGEVGRVMDYEIGTHAGCLPHRLEIQSGALPPGTTLVKTHSTDDDTLRDHSTFEVVGIPTEAGTFSAWIALRDCNDRSAESLFTFEIGRRTYAITTTSLPPATLGAPYSAKLQAGGHPVRSEEWELAAGQLPSGLTLAADGTISGTPTAAGSSTFTVKVTSVGDDFAERVDSRQFTIVVGGKVTVALSRRAAEVGVAFRSALSASPGQGPFRWTATGMPPGLQLASDGVITGVPAKAGVYTVTVRFGGAGEAAVVLRVYPRLKIATTQLPAAVAGRGYGARIMVRGGAPRFRWSIAGGTLPRGLRIAAGTGVITGTPTASGTARVTVRVRDSLGAVAKRTLVLRVR